MNNMVNEINLVPTLLCGNADESQFAESDQLEVAIKKNLAGLGYDV